MMNANNLVEFIDFHLMNVGWNIKLELLNIYLKTGSQTEGVQLLFDKMNLIRFGLSKEKAIIHKEKMRYQWTIFKSFNMHPPTFINFLLDKQGLLLHTKNKEIGRYRTPLRKPSVGSKVV